MNTFFKVQTTSLLASVVDFLVTILGVHVWQRWYVLASLTGAVCGGMVNFIVARKWTFSASNQLVGQQMGRFFLVWVGNAAINATGLFIATHFLDVQYLLAKTVVSILVGVSYNYLFQKDFVFAVP